MNKIMKAVFPLSSFSNGFLPATKAMPKEMMPIVDKPLIQYAVEEAAEAGISDIIFITGRGKRIIEDHFDKAYELEEELAASGKENVLAELRQQLPANMRFSALHLRNEFDLGDALLGAQSYIGSEAFALLMPDQLIDAQPSAMRQVKDVFVSTGLSVIGIQSLHGKVSVGAEIKGNSAPVRNRLQQMDAASENETGEILTDHVGRYIFNPAVFDYLSRLKADGQESIGLNDLLITMLKSEEIMECEIQGHRYDCRNKVDYMMAMTDYGMKHPAIGADLSAYVAALKAKKRARLTIQR